MILRVRLCLAGLLLLWFNRRPLRPGRYLSPRGSVPRRCVESPPTNERTHVVRTGRIKGLKSRGHLEAYPFFEKQSLVAGILMPATRIH